MLSIIHFGSYAEDLCIKMGVRKIGWGDRDWINLTQDKASGGLLWAL